MSTSEVSTSDNEANPLSKDQVMAIYMKSAKKMRKRTAKEAKGASKPKKQQWLTAATDAEKDQLLISVGKMKYDELKCKGVHDKAFPLQKIFINKDASYSSVLERIKAELYESDDMEGYEYYLSDNSGFPITKDGNIVLHKRDGSPESHPWTLICLCGVRYQSRARLFCIRKKTGPQSDTEAASDSGHDASDSAHGASKSGCPSGDTGNSGHDSAHGAACPSGNSGHDSVSRSSHVVTDSDPVCPSTNVVHNSSGTGESGRHEAGYDRGGSSKSSAVGDHGSIHLHTEDNHMMTDFEPLFAIMTKSRYENKFILRNSLTQQAALRDIARDDPDVVQGIDDYESKTSPVNPCSFEYSSWNVSVKKTPINC